MNSSILVTSPGIRLPEIPTASQQAIETADLLRQLIDLQREQLALSRAIAMNNDPILRWRRFLEKWQKEFPEIAINSKSVLPAIERVYLNMMTELTERLASDEIGDFDSEFVLGEFLDKFGMRLNQLSTIIGQLSPMADAAIVPQPEPESKDAGNEGPKS